MSIEDLPPGPPAGYRAAASSCYASSVTRCPTCEHPSAPRSTPQGENRAFPFCSARCKMIDLGKWLDEKYRVPGAEVDDDMTVQDSRHDRQATQQKRQEKE